MLSKHLKWDFLRRRPEECDSSKKANQNQDFIRGSTPNVKEGVGRLLQQNRQTLSVRGSAAIFGVTLVVDGAACDKVQRKGLGVVAILKQIREGKDKKGKPHRIGKSSVYQIIAITGKRAKYTRPE